MDLRPKCKTGHYNTLEENIGRTFHDSKILFDPPPREMEKKNKNKEMEPNET